MDYVALGPIADHVTLGIVSVDHISPFGSPINPQNTTKL